MRKIPIPLLVAALVSVAAVVMTLKLTLQPIPVYADPNFTGPLPAGNVAYWKGAFTEAKFVANTTVAYRYFYGAAIVVYAPNGIRNATFVRDSNNLGGFIQFINVTSGVYFVTTYPGGYYVAVKLVPTTVKGFYIGQPLTTDEIQMINKINTKVQYTLTGSGYHAINDQFYVTLLSGTGGTTSVLIPAAGQGTGQTFVIKGYDVNVNVVVRFVTGVAIIPKSNANVIVHVK